MSAAPRLLRASHTHLYPGARLRSEGVRLRRNQVLDIEFADLGSATARVEALASGQATLAVSMHRSARGTTVAAKRWCIKAAGDGEWRVLRRLADDG